MFFNRKYKSIGYGVLFLLGFHLIMKNILIETLGSNWWIFFTIILSSLLLFSLNMSRKIIDNLKDVLQNRYEVWKFLTFDIALLTEDYGIYNAKKKYEPSNYLFESLINTISKGKKIDNKIIGYQGEDFIAILKNHSTLIKIVKRKSKKEIIEVDNNQELIKAHFKKIKTKLEFCAVMI